MPTMTREAMLRERIRATLRLIDMCGLDDAGLAELTATEDALERVLAGADEARRAANAAARREVAS